MAATKSKKSITWLPIGMFPGFLMVSVGLKYDEIMSRLKKLPNGENWALALSEDRAKLEGNCKWFAFERTLVQQKSGAVAKHYYIILTEPFDFSDISMCKLAHEVLHICQFYLPDVISSRDREYECEAYLHTFLMDGCLQHFRKK